MARRKAFYEQEYSRHIGAVIMCIASFVAVALATCGTPLGMLMLRTWDETPEEGGNPEFRPCFTLWGKRNNCWNANYSDRVTDPLIAGCSDIRTRFEAAEAFSVIALFSLLFVFGASWSKICGSSIKTTVMVLSVFAIGATTVPWAIVTSFYYTPFCGLEFLTYKQTRFGAGYALLVASFAVQVLGLILFTFLEPEIVSTKREEDKEAGSDASSHASSASH
ncbi:amastin-like surface protein-like protein [Novymonas esmeraldas]|uniref:Amastin-like surface protein-like protein n=1 Tax=Novymonas esmeraldas TaxID=1808958 RepID=A0AAW0F0I2_9TRYP